MSDSPVWQEYHERLAAQLTVTRWHVAAIAFLVGVVVGLTVLGWWLWPVKWTDAGYQHLSQDRRAALVLSAADLHAYDTRNQYAFLLTGGWDAGQTACDLAAQSSDIGRRLRLYSLAHALGEVCP